MLYAGYLYFIVVLYLLVLQFIASTILMLD